MLKIEAQTLEGAYSQAAEKLSCSITQLNIEIIQTPTNGFLGFFKKQAIIVVIRKPEEVPVQEAPTSDVSTAKAAPVKEPVKQPAKEVKQEQIQEPKAAPKPKKTKPAVKKVKREQVSHNDIILPASFVTDQEEDDYDGSELYEDEEEVYVGEETQICDKSHDEIHQQLAGNIGVSKASSNTVDSFFQDKHDEVFKPSDVAHEIKVQVDVLFKHACFEIDNINVKEHDDKTILVEFSGKDAALLIGKEGYRYKALSYMLYNWINAKYQLQLRLEIAEFLKNQEEMIGKYLEGVFTNIDRDGKAQTKILDGVLVQIALRELRAAYPDKYVAIRSTRDGAKFIIINSFNNSNDNNNNN